MRWATPDDDRRRWINPGFFELFSSMLLRHRETYTAPDAIGAALWVPPGEQPVPQRSDLERLPAYLEATSARNRKLYERHGFKVVGQIALVRGPRLYPMWREPAGAGRSLVRSASQAIV